MCRKEHYFKTHPECTKISDDNALYPATSEGDILCAKDAGYTEQCYSSGFYDCRDCWCEQCRQDESDDVPRVGEHVVFCGTVCYVKAVDRNGLLTVQVNHPSGSYISYVHAEDVDRFLI